ncbi:MAG: T9SS type A sorting domain-containing protein [Flavobacteriales bacterium]
MFLSKTIKHFFGCILVQGILVVPSLPALAQIGPGGVVTGNKLWFKADQGVTSTLGNVSLWNDQSSWGNNATQGINTNCPDLITVLENYRPALHFNGNDDHLLVNDLIAAGSTSVSVFAAGTHEMGGDARHSLVVGQAQNPFAGGGYGISSLSTTNDPFGFWVRDVGSNQVGSNWIDAPMAVLEGEYGSGSLELYRNAELIGTDAFSGTVGDNGTTTIGGGPGTTNNHKGYIAEVAIYDRKLSSAERKRVNSYLALKYGRTLNFAGSGGEYVRSNGTAIFSDAGGHWKSVIGIGRDDNSALVQFQSHEPSDSVRIYLGTLAASNAANTSTFSGNNQFIVAGHNGNATCITDLPSLTMPTGIQARMPRSLNVANTGFGGSFTIELELGACGTTGYYSNTDLRLLVDDDGDYSNATSYAPGGGLSITVVGGYVRISGISNTQLPANTSRYMTVGVTVYTPPVSPGGVYSGNVFWSKADAGVTLTTGKVSAWADQSVSGNNATQATTADRPIWTSVNRNYNPSIYFNGNNDHLSMNDLIVSGSHAVSVFAVGTNESGGDTWHSMVFGQSNGTRVGGGYGICSLDGTNTTMGFWVSDYLANRAYVPFANRPMAINEGTYGWGTLEFYQNAELKANDGYAGTVGDNGTTHIGGGDATNYNHKGYISEVLIYNTKLSTVDRRRVNSYLGLKYGLTLERAGMNGKYLDSRGNTVFSDGGTSMYWKDVIGIGRDALGGLLQRQSKTADDSAKIYIGALATSNANNTGVFSNDRQYVVMGHNGGKLCATLASNLEKPAGISSRIEREWKITKTGYTGTFSVEFQLNACSDLTNIATTDLRLLVDADGDFTNATIYASGGTITMAHSGGRIIVSGVPVAVIPASATRYFTLASVTAATPLPIELLSFTATARTSTVDLDWSTASEHFNDHFTVERSADVQTWESIATVMGAGNSTQVVHYATVDQSPLPGISYYRLAQTDYDGTTVRSDMVAVRMSGSRPELLLIPNPANDEVELVISLSGPEPWRITLVDQTGRPVLMAIKATDKGYRLDVRSLPSGMYALRIEGNGLIWTERLVVRH